MATGIVEGPLGSTPKGVSRIKTTHSNKVGNKTKPSIAHQTLAEVKEIKASLQNLGGTFDNEYDFMKTSYKDDKKAKLQRGRKKKEEKNNRKRNRTPSTTLLGKIADQIKETFSKFGETVDSFAHTLKEGAKNVTHSLGEGIFRTILGPLGLLLSPIEQEGSFNLYEAIFKHDKYGKKGRGGKGDFGFDFDEYGPKKGRDNLNKNKAATNKVKISKTEININKNKLPKIGANLNKDKNKVILNKNELNKGERKTSKSKPTKGGLKSNKGKTNRDVIVLNKNKVNKGKGLLNKEKPVKKQGFFSQFANSFKSGGIFSKWHKGKPTRQSILPIHPESVLLYDALTGKDPNAKKEKSGGILDSLLGGLGGGLMGGLVKMVPKLLPFLSAAIPLLLFVGTMALDFFGKGGALDFFKKGKTDKGILTLLLGKDLSKKSTVGKLLGIGEQGLKWGALGFLISGGDPLGALIGFSIGASGAGIKLGFDSGWFKNTMVPWLDNAVKNTGSFIKGQIFDPIKSLLKSVGEWLGSFLASMPGTIAKVAVNVFDWAKINVVDPSLNAIRGVFDYLIGEVTKGFQTMGNFVSGLIDKVKTSITDFFGSIGDFFHYVGSKNILEIAKEVSFGSFGKNLGQYQQSQQFARTAMSDTGIQKELTTTKEFGDAYRGAGGVSNSKAYEMAMQRLIESISKSIAEGRKESPVIQNIIQDAYNIDSITASKFPSTN